MFSSRMAIAIPAYCRTTALRANLSVLLPEADRLGVAIYLSDDSPDDETEVAVAQFASGYSGFHYRRNTPALGHDRNIIETLFWPDAEYVWMLGDTRRPRDGELAAVLDFLDGRDFTFVNSHAPSIGDRKVEDAAAYELLKAVLWHQTLTGATIYHRRAIDWARSGLETVAPNFPHLSIILGYAEAHRLTLGWFDKQIIHTEPRSESYWRKRALNVFVDDWVSVIKAHPKIVPSVDLASVLKSHSASTYLFDSKFLWELRESGAFNITDVRRPHFWDVMHLSPLKLLALMILPVPVLKALLRVQ